MSWNYRVWHTYYEPTEEDFFEVKETYYNSSGEICACTESASSPSGCTQEELKESLQHMTDAMDEAIIETQGFVFAQFDFDKEASQEVDSERSETECSNP